MYLLNPIKGQLSLDNKNQPIVVLDTVDKSQLKVLRCQCPCPKESKKCYNFVVIGVTGAGKTTFCDSLVNFFLDVDFYDEFRYKLIDESAIVNKDKTKSQT